MADVTSTGEAFGSTDAQREVWPVIAEVQAGTALLNDGRPGVAYTASGGSVISQTIGNITISGLPVGGVGLDELQCSVATDGTFQFPVTGASASTVNGTAVFAVVAAGRVTGLTLTVGSNIPFGAINNPQDYVAVGTSVCVKIGV